MRAGPGLNSVTVPCKSIGWSVSNIAKEWCASAATQYRRQRSACNQCDQMTFHAYPPFEAGFFFAACCNPKPN